MKSENLLSFLKICSNTSRIVFLNLKIEFLHIYMLLLTIILLILFYRLDLNIWVKFFTLKLARVAKKLRDLEFEKIFTC